ncbi:MAG: hypothetical protein ABIP71_13260 [Verrucomicrobiota bacterium]
MKKLSSVRFPAIFLLQIACVYLLTGCATSHLQKSGDARQFSFATDSFSFPNELGWEYFFDEQGKWTHRRREPPPEYRQHCFVVALAAKQFFAHARFDSSKPVATEKAYREIIRKIVFRNGEEKTTVPGYSSLREFSAAQEKILKEECGGAWRSYFQRGHWRMLLPFSRHHQQVTSDSLVRELKERQAIVVHVVRFPQLSINHALVLFGFRNTETGIQFAVYDPNNPKESVLLNYDRATRTFLFPGNDYFIGGKVNVYEVYRSCLY